MEVVLEAKVTNHNSRLQLTTNRKGVIWFDQVSLMPMDTYKVFFVLDIYFSLNKLKNTCHLPVCRFIFVLLYFVNNYSLDLILILYM